MNFMGLTQSEAASFLVILFFYKPELLLATFAVNY